jgi:hypothetical protein
MLSVLLELWFTKLVKDFEKEFRAIVSAASEYNGTIIPGAITGKIAGNVYVSCPFIASDRSILGRQLFVWLSKKKIQIWFNIVLVSHLYWISDLIVAVKLLFHYIF